MKIFDVQEMQASYGVTQWVVVVATDGEHFAPVRGSPVFSSMVEAEAEAQRLADQEGDEQ